MSADANKTIRFLVQVALNHFHHQRWDIPVSKPIELDLLKNHVPKKIDLYCTEHMTCPHDKLFKNSLTCTVYTMINCC